MDYIKLRLPSFLKTLGMGVALAGIIIVFTTSFTVFRTRSVLTGAEFGLNICLLLGSFGLLSYTLMKSSTTRFELHEEKDIFKSEESKERRTKMYNQMNDSSIKFLKPLKNMSVLGIFSTTVFLVGLIGDYIYHIILR